MRRRSILFPVILLVLSGCAGLQQFPDVSPTDLATLDAQYAATLQQIYPEGTLPTEAQQKRVRNKYIEERMAVIDTHFREFETDLAKESVGVDFGVALAGVAVGAAGTFAAETASRILSAVSGGLAGAQAAYSKAALYDQASTALLAQMHAGRKAVAVEIFSRWTLGIEEYPLWLAKRDADAYYFAGSLPGAIVATSADAKVKEQQADALLQELTFNLDAAAENLRDSICGTDPDCGSPDVSRFDEIRACWPQSGVPAGTLMLDFILQPAFEKQRGLVARCMGL